MIEKLHNKQIVYKGRVIDVVNDTVILPNNKKARREYIKHPGAVAAVVFKDKDSIIMIRQYRHPIGEITWEIPAGKLDGGESPLNCLKRELAEETGMRAKKIKYLLSYWPTAAFSTEVIHIYAAWNLSPSPAKPDSDEFLEQKTVKLKTCYDWIKNGKIKDSKTIIALLALLNPAFAIGIENRDEKDG